MSELLKSLRLRFPAGGFAHSALIMMTGTGFAQAISLAIAPILARLYLPSDYGVFALYSSVSSLVAVLATGRYDGAIMLPEKEEDAINLVALSTSITVVTSLISLVVVLFMNQAIARWLGSPEAAPWLFLIPLSVVLGGLYQAMYCWSVRTKHFQELSVGKVFGASAAAAISLGVGLCQGGVGGLILAAIVNQGVTAAVLAWQLRRRDWVKRTHVRRSAIRALMQRYHRFPLYAMPSDFVNSAAQQAPVMLLSNFFGTIVVGHYSITQRVLGLPLTLVASSVTDVFRQRASSDFARSGNCRGIYLKTLKSLLVLATPPFLIFVLTAPWLFSTVFGANWRIAGEYAQVMAPLLFLRFVVSPLSYVFYIAEKQNYDLVGQVLLFLGSVTSIWAGAIRHDPKLSLVLFSASYSLVYLIYLACSFVFSKR